jgi:hypothetical protein
VLALQAARLDVPASRRGRKNPWPRYRLAPLARVSSWPPPPLARAQNDPHEVPYMLAVAPVQAPHHAGRVMPLKERHLVQVVYLPVSLPHGRPSLGGFCPPPVGRESSQAATSPALYLTAEFSLMNLGPWESNRHLRTVATDRPVSRAT